MGIAVRATIAESFTAQHGPTAASWTFQIDRAPFPLGPLPVRTESHLAMAAYVESADEDAVRDTILHEIAHVLVGAFVLKPTGAVIRDRQRRDVTSDHRWQWKLKEQEIGCSGQLSGHNPAATAKQGSKVDAARSRAEHVAHITAGPLQVGELV